MIFFMMWGNFLLMKEEDVKLSFQKVKLNDGVTFGKSCVFGKIASKQNGEQGDNSIIPHAVVEIVRESFLQISWGKLVFNRICES
jgi:hypothetical protein